MSVFPCFDDDSVGGFIRCGQITKTKNKKLTWMSLDIGSFITSFLPSFLFLLLCVPSVWLPLARRVPPPPPIHTTEVDDDVTRLMAWREAYCLYILPAAMNDGNVEKRRNRIVVVVAAAAVRGVVIIRRCWRSMADVDWLTLSRWWMLFNWASYTRCSNEIIENKKKISSFIPILSIFWSFSFLIHRWKCQSIINFTCRLE